MMLQKSNVQSLMGAFQPRFGLLEARGLPGYGANRVRISVKRGHPRPQKQHAETLVKLLLDARFRR